MKTIQLFICSCLLAGSTIGQIKVNPTGVNVNTNGATSAFLSFGRLVDQVPVEAFWCGELTDASPDLGSKCDPATVFGQLPIRYDLSSVNQAGVFTDIMSIPPSVARRAYQAAKGGADSRFFYVRRFASTTGAPDEYVAVTCRLAGGGARVPFSLLDVSITSDTDTPVLFIKANEKIPDLVAEIYYNGTGQLRGRWEVVLPGDELPTTVDLLTEASLPVEQRRTQKRYTEISRFNVFLPPTGKFLLPGPDVRKVPTKLDGLHMILLRIEATADKEGDSNAAAVGGMGVVHSGAVAGFPIPPLRYYVGEGQSEQLLAMSGDLQLLLPPANAMLSDSAAVVFSWIEVPQAALYQLQVKNSENEAVLGAYIQPGIETYQAPDWFTGKSSGASLLWRVIALNFSGKKIQSSDWRALMIAK